MNNAKKKVLICTYRYSQNCPAAKRFLEENGFEIIENPYERPFTPDELKAAIPEIYAAAASVEIWNEDIFKVAKELKLIARFGIGVDNIDLEKAKEYGIMVSNARGSTNAVAELAVGYMIAVLRKIVVADQSVRLGNWNRFVGREIKGKKVGLVGFGQIPQLIAKKMQHFDAQLMAFDKAPNHDKAKEFGVHICALDELLTTSDIISSHLPITEETYKFFNRERFQKMKDGAYFINTGRGALVEENDLYDALISNKLSGAALDVYDPEPPHKGNPLFQLDNVVAGPHSGSDTIETIRLVADITAQAMVDLSNGKKPQNLLNG